MKTMTDASGHEVPVKYVNAYDRARDAACRRIEARFRRARGVLEAVVAESLADLEKVRALAAKTGEKGNFQISSFDGMVTVSVEQSYRIKLDEHVAEARELMFGYAKRLAGKVEGRDGAALLQIIETAFSATRTGALPYGKILALLRLNISDPDWLRAKDLLAAAIQPEPGKAYLSCKVRPDRQHDAVPIRLDLADCWPVAKGEAK